MHRKSQEPHVDNSKRLSEDNEGVYLSDSLASILHDELLRIRKQVLE